MSNTDSSSAYLRDAPIAHFGMNATQYNTLHTAHEEIAKNGWWLISLHYLADVVENRKMYCLADRCCIFT